MVMSLIAKSGMSSARTALHAQTVRALSTSAVAKKDFVQEAYLRELKSYKPPAKSADAHKGQVREFHQPKPPQAPQVPSSSDLSSELNSYASSEPDHAEAALSSKEGESSGPRQGVQAFLEEARKPIEPEHH